MTYLIKGSTLAFCSLLLLQPPSVSTGAGASQSERISRRAAKLVEDKLEPKEHGLGAEVQRIVATFYTDLSEVHAARDEALRALPGGDVAAWHRLQFGSEKEAEAVYGKFLGALARVLTPEQVTAIKDGMTFDMVPSSVATYQRMFPQLEARHRDQLRAWLEASREGAITAGSAETKLDVFRVNKLRMHAYLETQGLDVAAAVQAEEARKSGDQ
ncbi:MAG TPA: DUF3826 domain-containing protein [Candidatus Synoicihabitans sp.]|nr:DUF3826 domain-containing protein [Candidatus Synoicihabitans sp.]